MKIAAHILMVLAFCLVFINRTKELLVLMIVLVILNVISAKLSKDKPKKVNNLFVTLGKVLIILMIIFFVATLLNRAWIQAVFFGAVLTQLILYGERAKPKVLHKPVAQMTGLEFEEYCAKYLMQTGRFTNVLVTPPSGDFGADIVAYDRNGKKWVFQCKHYKKKVPNDAVQEVVAAKAHYKANKAAVMTNSQLQKRARQLALENDIELFEMLSD